MPDLISALHLSAAEITLAVGGLVLLLVGAFLGDKSARLVSGLSVLLLLVATGLAVTGPLGQAFEGAYVADPLAVPRKPLTATAQVRMCGNSVSPPQARSLVVANFAHELVMYGEAA